jgi:hypothetical protein
VRDLEASGLVRLEVKRTLYGRRRGGTEFVSIITYIYPTATESTP